MTSSPSRFARCTSDASASCIPGSCTWRESRQLRRENRLIQREISSKGGRGNGSRQDGHKRASVYQDPVAQERPKVSRGSCRGPGWRSALLQSDQPFPHVGMRCAPSHRLQAAALPLRERGRIPAFHYVEQRPSGVGAVQRETATVMRPSFIATPPSQWASASPSQRPARSPSAPGPLACA